MSQTKPKSRISCDCGQTVAVGSVFCLNCRSQVQKKNDQVIKREEGKYQRMVKLRVKKPGLSQ
jgi:hypothetical protein